MKIHVGRLTDERQPVERAIFDIRHITVTVQLLIAQIRNAAPC